MTVMDFAKLAKKEYRNYEIFKALTDYETVPQFKDALKGLATYEKKHYEFWQQYAPKVTYGLSRVEVKMFLLIRKIFGLTFTIRLLELQEGELIEEVREHLFHSNHPAKSLMEEIIHVDEVGEQKLLAQIKEERVEFLGSIVLGLNDGLIELSGALTGFSFAFHNNTTVFLAGLILGVSASLSMASSSYLQSRQEKGKKDPIKASIYTGIAYMIVVILLILPFLIYDQIAPALTSMILTVFIIVSIFSFYSSVVFKRKFKRNFIEMLTFSVGTALVSFAIATLARAVFNLEI